MPNKIRCQTKLSGKKFRTLSIVSRCPFRDGRKYQRECTVTESACMYGISDTKELPNHCPLNENDIYLKFSKC